MSVKVIGARPNYVLWGNRLAHQGSWQLADGPFDTDVGCAHWTQTEGVEGRRESWR